MSEWASSEGSNQEKDTSICEYPSTESNKPVSVEECTVRVHLCGEMNPRPPELSPLHLGVKVKRVYSNDEISEETSGFQDFSDDHRNPVTAKVLEAKQRKRNGPYDRWGGRVRRCRIPQLRKRFTPLTRSLYWNHFRAWRLSHSKPSL